MINQRESNNSLPILIGIAGGSGSGKTTFAEMLYDMIGGDNSIYFSTDNYYKDLSEIPFDSRIKSNFDHPDAFEANLLYEHLCALKENRSVQMPVYDFKNHVRKEETITVKPKNVIIIEGILLFALPSIKHCFNIKIFVDTSDDIRLMRRLTRDIIERERTLSSVIDQYLSTVRPMHYQYVEPSKKECDFFVDGTKPFENVVKLVSDTIRNDL